MKYYCILAIDKASKEVFGYCSGYWSKIQCELYRVENKSPYLGQASSFVWRRKKDAMSKESNRSSLLKFKGHLQEMRKKVLVESTAGRFPAEYLWNTLKLNIERIATRYPNFEIGLYRANSKHCPARVDVDSYGRRRSPAYEAKRWGLECVMFKRKPLLKLSLSELL